MARREKRHSSFYVFKICNFKMLGRDKRYLFSSDDSIGLQYQEYRKITRVPSPK